MISENITYSNDFLQDTTLRVSYLINIPSEELFPVEDHPVYMKYIEIEKIKRTELLELESALSKLLNE